jgi:predicted dehydrogenase
VKKIKIAQIGINEYSHSQEIFGSITKQNDIFEFVGYALRENEEQRLSRRASELAACRKMTVEEILSDPEIEAVAVETEEIYLLKYALMVAKAGKHLHMEKPGSPSLTDFRALVSLLKEKKLTFSLGYMYRFNPKVKEALTRIKNGELGKIFAVEAEMCCKHSKELREWLHCFPGGMTFFLGCHLIDLVYQILGVPKEVIPLNCRTGFDGVDSVDFGMAAFRYENGVSFIKAADVEVGGFTHRRLRITGEKGSIEIKPLEYYPHLPESDAQTSVMSECFDQKTWQTEWQTTESAEFDRYDDMIRHFADRKDPLCIT